MHKEIVINSSPNEVRVALLEDRDVVEFMMERADHKRAVGNVYKGVVTAVRPGLQAAFVDIGMEKGGFLHVSDLVHDDPVDDDDRGRGRGRGRRREGLRPIETMLREGDEILVQVTKEVIGTKGPRLTADISLPGRFMVLMPKGDHVGVSRKIEDRKERGRLKSILSDLKPEDEAGAFIIRTAAIGQDARMIERDMQYLRDLWKEIQHRAHETKAPAVAHEDVGLIVSLIRDIFKDDVDSVVVDSKEDHQRLMQYVKTFSPDLRDRIHLYQGELPVFDKFGIEAELKKSLDKKVWMKRGGFLVIEQTEALVAIDVNTGRFIGKKNQAETIFKTNMLAAKEIARQLRLRDVGGIIVLDFIDMDSEDDKRKVLAELRQHLKRDRSRTKTFAVSELGLIEMSRQRVQESLKDRLSDNCPYCNGSGQVLSVDTLANKVERLLTKLGATRNEKSVQVRANPTLALQLMTERANTVQQIERSTGIQIDVVDDARLHREEFQIVSLQRRKDLVAEIEKSDQRGGGGEPRRDRAEQERDRGGRRRRGRDREEEPAAAEARESRRGRRRRSESGADEPERRGGGREESRERPAGRENGERRRRRRRRPDEEKTAETPARDTGDTGAATQEQAEAATTPAGGQGPSQQEGERPKRRRRRGRRGGRGRRRGSRGEESVASGSAPESPAAESAEKRAARDEAPVPAERGETRPAERRDRRGESLASEAAEAGAEAKSSEEAKPSGEEHRSERRTTRRRRRTRSRRTETAAEETSATAPESPRAERPPREERPSREERRSREERPPREERSRREERASREDGPPRAERGPREERPPRERRSRRGRDRARERLEETESVSTSAEGMIDTPESYLRPVPETDSSAAPAESTAEDMPPTSSSEGQEPREDDESSRAPEREDPQAAASPAEPSPRSDQLEPESEPESKDEGEGKGEGKGEDEDEDDPRSRRRRRRRRTRAVGTPTRMIGTGKTLDQKKR